MYTQRFFPLNTTLSSCCAQAWISKGVASHIYARLGEDLEMVRVSSHFIFFVVVDFVSPADLDLDFIFFPSPAFGVRLLARFYFPYPRYPCSTNRSRDPPS
jgi:hypothetical protein